MTLLTPDTIEGIDFDADVICESGTGCDLTAEWRFIARPCPSHHTLLCDGHAAILREYMRLYPYKTIQCPKHASPRVPVFAWGTITRL